MSELRLKLGVIFLLTTTIHCSPTLEESIFHNKDQPCVEILLKSWREHSSQLYARNVPYINLVTSPAHHQLVTSIIRHTMISMDSPIQILQPSQNTRTTRDFRNRPVPTNNGVFVFVGLDQSELRRILSEAESCLPAWSPRAQFIMYLLDDSVCRDSNRQHVVATQLLREMWRLYQILRSWLVIGCLEGECNNSKTWSYDPYRINKDNGERGVISDHGLEEGFSEAIEKEKVKNLHGYPVTVSLFQQYPTSILVDKNRELPLIERYTGIDGSIMATLARFLNFKPELYKQQKDGFFGFTTSASKMVGGLADVAARRVDISFNSRFVKDYGTKEVEFVVPVTTDKICIVVPKAKRLPQWKNMIVCFDKNVWGCLLASFTIVVNQLRVFTVHSVPKTPTWLHDRILFGGSFLFSLVMTSVFQGFLVNNLAKPMYEEDIDRLEQLSASGMPVLSRSPDRYDVFSDTDNTAIKQLNKMFTLFRGSEEQLLRHVIDSGKEGFIARKSMTPLFETRYLSDEGTPLLHGVGECPAFYYLAYIVPRGYPLLARINQVIRRAYSSGLESQWRLNTQKQHILNTNANNRKEPKTFNVYELQLPFIILSLGLSLGCVSFIVERRLNL